MEKKIAILCAQPNSIYFAYDYLDIYDAARDAYNFCGTIPVIAHPPCQQWSRLRTFARSDQREKDLAMFCLDFVRSNGGIFEHPMGSSFFRYAGISPTISVNQSWFGFPTRKSTYLFFAGCRPLSYPLSFDLPAVRNISQLNQRARSTTTKAFAEWLISSTLTCI